MQFFRKVRGVTVPESIPPDLAGLRRQLGTPAGGSAANLGPCPPQERLDLLAAGLLSDEDADQILAHAAACSTCAALLRESVEIFQPLPEALPVRRNSTRWLAAAAAAVVVSLASWWGYHTYTQPPTRLLAQAYAESRPFAAMWPGADHAPLKRTHGPSGTRPPSLLRAELKIQEHLASGRPDPAWLQAQAATELFELNPGAALKTLERAADLGASSPALDLQLAVTYLTRGDEQSRDPDYRQAAELLGRVLMVEPSNPAALFNRALVFERLRLPDQGIADLRAYLALNPPPAWREEALQRLRRLEQMQASLRHQPKASSLRERDLLAVIQDGRLDRIPSSEAAQFAALLEREHQDPWLAAWQSRLRHAPAWAQSVAALRLVDTDPVLALKEAGEALDFFGARI